ncbi:response regulator [Pedobacter sp. G11]|uniref:response regulator transcription factor n=1 Tax=Pedobacter sp. G11 TaxID=2482728 RepID=UPI000F5F59DA|nr:response regulator [Pedobacter sp. G11]AZI26791.1 response regulator [Pedobacter sp. G11]
MKKRICVLEDNEGIMDVLHFLFTDENYDVFGYSCVEAMLPEMYNLNVDIFLLDIMLPDGSGLTVCDLLKTNKFTRHLPVVMMSAARSSADVQSACMADDFVAKPFDVNDLLIKVNAQILR